MLPILVAAALLSGPTLREPVGRGPAPADPVGRRVASLLSGSPVVYRSVAVVPLYAPLPSAAGHGSATSVTWLDDELQARPVFDAGELYLRILNPTKHPVLVPAGTLFRHDGAEVFAGRGVVVPAQFAALLPATPHGPVTGAEHEPAGRVTPVATGAALHGGIAVRARVLSGWGVLGADRFADIQRLPQIRGPSGRLALRCEPVLDDFAGTAVGAVFLIGNRPVAAHVFGRHDHFRAAFPGLARAVYIQARQAERVGDGAAIRSATRKGDPIPPALAFLRSMLRRKGATSDSYDKGREVTFRDPLARAVGHAVLGPEGELVHLGAYAVGGLWPAENGAPGAAGGGAAGVPGAEPGRPDRRRPTPSEESPGATDRRPRPSLAAERQRARRPGPPDTGSPSPANQSGNGRPRGSPGASGGSTGGGGGRAR